MRFSNAWLREFVAHDLSPEALGAQLTMAGLELDAIEPAAPAFEKVVVGRVVAAEQHPNADRLRVCEVDAGTGEMLSIVCGAPNARADIRVAVALVGARLPGDFKIKRSKLRGVASAGMLCSTRELGLGEEHDGIMELPADAPVGTPLREYLDLDDTIIEVDLTPNRGDCLGLIGIAREVSALNNIDAPQAEVAEVPSPGDDVRGITLSAPQACPVYAGRVIRGIRPNATSPLWLQERLRRSGLRAIHPVVDVTNYVMLERGQPMHGFDHGKLSGDIDVRMARAGEQLTLLDGKEVTLEDDMLLITDASGPVALAGVMGGESTAVDDDTVDVFFESAWFAPTAIAGRARRIGLHTDASHRYERGVDPQGQVAAIERATALLIDIVGGTPGPVVLAQDPSALPSRPAVALRRSQLDRLIGIHVPDDAVEAGFERLGLAMERTGDEGWQVTPPSFRFDINIEADLIEEVARLYGYDNIPAQAEAAPLTVRPVSESRLPDLRLKQLMVDRDYQEAITYSFQDPELLAKVGMPNEGATLANPISSDLAVMRPSLLPGLLVALRQNVARQRSRVRLFEVGARYLTDGQGGFREEKMLAGVACGTAKPEGWANGAAALDFFDVKGDLEALLASTSDASIEFVPGGPDGLVHPGKSAWVRRGDEEIGFLGAMHPSQLTALDLPANTYCFELSMAALTKGGLPSFQAVSKYPSSRRDLALLVDEATPAQEIVRTIRDAAGPLLQEVVLFDEYRGDKVDSGLKSIALGLILQESSRNLTGEEADQVIDQVRQHVAAKLGAKLRD
ncbi:MAG: phenylalanine--tRNA ligase subunit beta [Pseudomonadota bacterium]